MACLKFLDASSHLIKRLCPSVGRSVRRSLTLLSIIKFPSYFFLPIKCMVNYIAWTSFVAPAASYDCFCRHYLLL